MIPHNNFRVLDFRNEFHGRSDYFFNADPMNPDGVAITVKMNKI
jgi:hypothetical protein